MCPTTVIPSIQKLNTLIKLGRTFQLQPSATLEDHVPVYAEIDIAKKVYKVNPHSPPASRDSLMSAQTKGCRRKEFFDAVAQELAEDDENYQCAMQRNSVQAVWNHIGDAVRGALAEVFPPGPDRSEEYEANRKRRMELIKQRGRLRAEGAENNTE
eukprot:3460427-Pyramimonas_sp.AAC.1